MSGFRVYDLKLFDQFQLSAPINIETSHLICNVNQINDFYMQCHAKLKLVNWKSGIKTTTLYDNLQISLLILSEFK